MMLTRKIQKTSALVALLLAMALSPCFGKSITLTRASKKASAFLRSLEFITTINADYDEQSQKLTIDFDEDFGDVMVSIENEHGTKIYSSFFRAAPHSTMSFSIQSISSGTYNLIITPVRCASVEGSFTVDD